MDVGWTSFFALAVLNAMFAVAWKPFFSGYMSKKGERLATTEDTGKILQELRAVTRTAEGIKAEVGVGVWSHQTIWTLKKDIYFRCIETLAEHRKHLEDFILFTFLAPDKTRGQEAAIKCEETRTRIFAIAGIAALVLGPSARSAFEAYSVVLEPAPDVSENLERREAEMRGVTVAVNNLIISGAQELGINLPWGEKG